MRVVLVRSVLVVLVMLAALVPEARGAEPHLTVTTGTITGFDQQSALLNVNTRLGPKFFLVTAQTIIFLNDRAGTNASLTAGSEVELEYRFDTSEALFIRVFRETRMSGRVLSTTATTLVFRRENRGQATLRLDGQSKIRLAGIGVDNEAVLIGRRGTVVVEPGTLLVLRYSGDASEFNGTVSAVDALSGTITVAGKKKTRTFEVDPVATVRLNDALVDLADLAPGDRIRVAYFKDGVAGALEAVR